MINPPGKMFKPTRADLVRAPVGTKVLTEGMVHHGLWWIRREPVGGIEWQGVKDPNAIIGIGLLADLAVQMEEPSEQSP